MTFPPLLGHLLYMSKNTQPKCPIKFKCLFHNNKIVKALRVIFPWLSETKINK